jgi:ankyrin repeat protein
VLACAALIITASFLFLLTRTARTNAALLEAVRRDDVAAVRSLLLQGADPNARELPHSPAIQWTSIRTFMASLRARRAFRVEEGSGRTALFLAAMRGRVDEVKALIAAGADLNCQNSREVGMGITPLIGAIQKDDSAMINTLIRRGACVNHPDMWGTTPVSWAAKSNYLIPQLILWLWDAKRNHTGCQVGEYQAHLIVGSTNNVRRSKRK